jgi:RNA polymerase sigma-70 factor (ECF subfamily)
MAGITVNKSRGPWTKTMVEHFIEDYADRAYSVALKLCGDADDAREIVQEAFLKLLKGWERAPSGRPIEAWFITVLRNVYRDSMRRWERRFFVPLHGEAVGEGAASAPRNYLEALPDGSEDLLAALERREDENRLRRALDCLPPAEKAILVLCEAEGLKYRQISEILGCPLGTVRSRIFRARTSLRKALLEKKRPIRV